MPKISPEPIEQSTDPFQVQMNDTLTTVSLSVQPVFVCGISRKVNVGNYENIDIYAGLTLPLGVADNEETLKEMVAAAADLGFGLVSEETGTRYNLLKEMQRNARKPS